MKIQTKASIIVVGPALYRVMWQGPLNGSSTSYQYFYCESGPHQLSGLYSTGTTCANKSGQLYKSTYSPWGDVTGRTYQGVLATLTNDSLDHLVKWGVGGGNNEYYAYDAAGNRVLRRTNKSGTTTMTIYAFGKEEHLYSGTGTNQNNTYYYSLAGRLVGELTGTTPSTSIFLTDALGSVLTTFSNAAGTAKVLANRVYGPYGSQRFSSGTSMGTDKGFTGQYTDPFTGLDYYNARYYDPVVGVFLSADKVQGNPQGMNPYAYVQGNPETKNDPTGHKQVGACDPNSGIDCPPSPPPPGQGTLGGGGYDKGIGDGFPQKGTSWRHKNQKVDPRYQVWRSYLEYDPKNGWHVNFHFTPFGGGEDIYDYHIYFDASSPSEFIWRIYDSVTGKVKIYTFWKPFDAGPDDFQTLQGALEDALIAVTSEATSDISGGSAFSEQIHDPDLFWAIFRPLGEAFQWVAQKGLGMKVSPDAFQP